MIFPEISVVLESLAAPWTRSVHANPRLLHSVLTLSSSFSNMVPSLWQLTLTTPQKVLHLDHPADFRPGGVPSPHLLIDQLSEIFHSYSPVDLRSTAFSCSSISPLHYSFLNCSYHCSGLLVFILPFRQNLSSTVSIKARCLVLPFSSSTCSPVVTVKHGCYADDVQFYICTKTPPSLLPPSPTSVT